MALIVGAVLLVNWSTRTEPLERQWQTFVGERINVNSQTAAQIYENEGIEGLEEYFSRLTNIRRVNSIGFFDEKRKLIAGDLKYAEISDLFERALESDKSELIRLSDEVYGAKKVVLENGETYIYVLELRRFRPPALFVDRILLPGLVVLLMAGLVCYALARYLSSPISKLRLATQRFASGDLQARVSDKTSMGRDELSRLADDFDNMAERIESLVNSEKRLTRDISHELRSPLARVNVALELARQKANDETLPIINRLERESARLNGLIERLLTLSKLETGSQRFDKTEVNLGKFVERIVEDADFEANAKGKSVEIVQSVSAKVFGNEQLLRSAVENVLRNAVRHTKQDTTVNVSIKSLDNCAIIGIQDHGDGVPEEDLEHLFRPFYRIQEARDRKSGGTGLGLAIAESAVSNHNGQISARNTENGLLVEIRIPLLGD